MRVVKLTSEEARTLTEKCDASSVSSFLDCVEEKRRTIRQVLARDRYWGLVGVYEPDVDGVARWLKAVGQGGSMMVTWYGSRTGKRVVDLSKDEDVEFVTRLVEESFNSAISGIGRRGLEIDPSRAFTVSGSLWIDVGGSRWLSRVVLDIDAVSTNQKGDFAEDFKVLSLAASSIYAEMSSLGAKPLRHVIVYVSGSKGIHVEVLIPTASAVKPECPRDGRAVAALASMLRGVLPSSIPDVTQEMNMVARLPHTANISTGVPKVALGEDGKPVEYVPVPEPLPYSILTKLLVEVSKIPKEHFCSSSIGTERKSVSRGSRGALRAWDALVEAFRSGALPRLSDCRERFARMLGRWCRARGLDEQQCLETFEQCVEGAKRSYATYIRQGMREGEHLMPAHPEKIFCGQEWYSCQEVQLCDAVRRLLNHRE